MPIRSSRRGTTLLELLFALALAGFAMLGGIALLSQIEDGDARITTNAARDGSIANGDRLLRRLLIDARTTVDTTQRFRGDERNASFLTVCDRPPGWPELCRALLSIDSLVDSSDVVTKDDCGGMYVVRRIAGRAVFRYLDPTATGDSMWVGQWMTSIAPPAAIALIGPSDTTVLPVGSVHE